MRPADGSRPHGAFHAKVERITKAAPSFATARSSLVGILENLSFLSVVSVQDSKGGYVGEAVEVHFRDNSRDAPKMVFFDKFGRSRAQLAIGPMHLAQAPLGLDHKSSIPTVGEILVGSVVPNTRQGNLKFVLRGWSSDAKPLKELLRLLKFGTKLSEFESRPLLLQSSCLLMQCPASLKKSRDDIYMTARIILWGSIRPLQVLAAIQEPKKFTLKTEASAEETSAAELLKLSSSASDFVDLLVVKLHDPDLSDAFTSGLNISEEPEAASFPAPALTSYQYGQSYTSSYNMPLIQPGYGMPAVPGNMYPGVTQESSRSPAASQASQAYNPEQVFRPITPQYSTESPTNEAYAPSSPVYAPSSPVYAPSSPYAASSPVYAPSSLPPSPPQNPQSNTSGPDAEIAKPAFMPAKKDQRSATPDYELYSNL